MQKGGRSRTRKPRNNLSALTLQRLALKKATAIKLARKKNTKKNAKSLQEIAHEKEQKRREIDAYARAHGLSRNKAKRKLGYKK